MASLGSESTEGGRPRSPGPRLRFGLRTLLLIVTAAGLLTAIASEAIQIRLLASQNKSLAEENQRLAGLADMLRMDGAADALRAAGAASADRWQIVIDENWRGYPGLFAKIAELHDLNGLVLARSPVTNEDLAAIVGLPRLTILNLDETQVDDGCIASITAVKSLNTLMVRDTGITRQGIQRIRAALPTLKIVAWRVLVAVDPQAASAGLGCQAAYTVTVTNAGSDPDTFELSALARDLPLFDRKASSSWFDATTHLSWDPHWPSVNLPRQLLVPPGAGNAQSVTLTVRPTPTATPRAYPVDISVHSATDRNIFSSVSTTLNVLPLGVTIALTPQPMPGVRFQKDVVPVAPPGTTFEAKISNPGESEDTYELSLAGLGAALGALESKSVTLAAGASQTVKVTTRAVKFADANLLLTVAAVSQTDSAVRAEASWILVMGGGGRELKPEELESFLSSEGPSAGPGREDP